MLNLLLLLAGWVIAVMVLADLSLSLAGGFIAVSLMAAGYDGLRERERP